MANANGSKAAKAVRAALVALFGGGQRNGFVSHAPQAQAANEPVTVPAFDPRGGQRLSTEADGRSFAVALLRELRRQDGSIFSAVREGVDSLDGAKMTFRTGPQSRLIADTFDVIYSVNEAARRGFFQIISDHLGQAYFGTYSDPGIYEKWETEGRYDKPIRLSPEAARVLHAIEDEIRAQPALVTQKDGRMFAVAALERLDEADADEASACPFNPNGTPGNTVSPPDFYRREPQWDGFIRDLLRLCKEGAEQAQIGFASVFSDVLAGDIGRSFEALRDHEERGLFQDFPERGDEREIPGLAEHERIMSVRGRQEGDVGRHEGEVTQSSAKKRKQTKAERAVVEAVESLQLPIDQLHDIGKRLDKSPFSYFTIRAATKALASKAQDEISECLNPLPTGHPARKELRMAGEALNDLLASVESWVDAYDSGSHGPFDKAQGKAMVAFVVDAAQALERAELACGETVPTAGWLEHPDMDPNAECGA